MKTRNVIILSVLFIITGFNLSKPVSSILTSFDYYQFVNDTKIQANGWTFDLTIKDSQWSSPSFGLILSYKYYNIDNSSPVNYISPVDILIATGEIAENPDDYNFSFSWGDRYVNVSFISTPSEASKIVSSIGNIHCIARNQESLTMLKSFENRTSIQLSGYLVDINGWNTTNTLRWETDTVFGNEDCEILVISDVVPIDVSIEDIYTIILLLIGVGISATVLIYMHYREKRACRIEPYKKISSNL